MFFFSMEVVSLLYPRYFTVASTILRGVCTELESSRTFHDFFSFFGDCRVTTVNEFYFIQHPTHKNCNLCNIDAVNKGHSCFFLLLLLL